MVILYLLLMDAEMMGDNEAVIMSILLMLTNIVKMCFVVVDAKAAEAKQKQRSGQAALGTIDGNGTGVVGVELCTLQRDNVRVPTCNPMREGAPAGAGHGDMMSEVVISIDAEIAKDATTTIHQHRLGPPPSAVPGTHGKRNSLGVVSHTLASLGSGNALKVGEGSERGAARRRSAPSLGRSSSLADGMVVAQGEAARVQAERGPSTPMTASEPGHRGVIAPRV